MHDKEWRKEYKYKKRTNILKILGNKCVNCGDVDQDVLQFDHIEDDGWKDKHVSNKGEIRRKHRSAESLFSEYNSDPTSFVNKYQILCANCNQRKEIIRRELNRLAQNNIPMF